jgi:hypothetical protein
VTTFWTLKEGADFENRIEDGAPRHEPIVISQEARSSPQERPRASEAAGNVELKVGYTINLNLPETTNPDVFNAIFKSLKEHLLRG